MSITKRLLFLIPLVLIAVVLLRNYYHVLEQDSDKFIQDTQDRLDASMEKMLADEQKVLNYLQENNRFDFNKLSKLQTEFPFFIYKNGQLVFWNEEVIVPELKYDLGKRWDFYNVASGKYLFLSNTSTDKDVVLLFVNTLYANYEVNNEYISPYYNPDIFTQEDIVLLSSFTNNGHTVKDLNGQGIFQIQLADDFINHQSGMHSLILAVEFILLALLVLLLWKLSNKFLNKNIWLACAILFIGLLLLRVLMWGLDFPFHSAEISLFNPKYFASSALNPSFGALLINCMLLFIFALFIIIKVLRNQSSAFYSYSVLKSVFFSFLTYALFLLLFGFIESIYRHSQWGIDISNTIDLNIFKALTILTFLGFSIFLYFIINWVHQWITLNVASIIPYLRDQLLAVTVFLLFCYLIKAPFVWVAIVVTSLNLLVYWLRLNKHNNQLTFVSFIYLFVVVSAISAVCSWSTYHMEAIQRSNDQSRFANRVLNDSDVLAEYLISQMHESLKTDKQIQNQFLLPITPFNSVANKIDKYYLSDDYFEKYEREITIYDNLGNALYPLKAPSFQNHIEQEELSTGNLRAGDYLYLLRFSESPSKSKKYVYLFDVIWSNYVLATICVELSPKKVQPDNVFPELLVDKRFIPDVQEVPYDYALYQNDSLVYKVGGTTYPDFATRNNEGSLESYIQENNQGSNQVAIIGSPEEMVVFTTENESLLSLFSKFSFFFIVCFSIVVLFSIYYFLKAYLQNTTIGLSAKIQLFFSMAFLIPLISISVSTISFVNATFLQDIVKSYQERISRVGDHLTRAIMDYDAGKINKEELTTDLLNTTKIVNSDLNIYNLNGKRILTSQPQIFEKNLLSDFINPAAYVAIKHENKQLFTLEEQIGKLDYKTAYNAIYSYNTGELLAILASPFFKSSKEYDALLANLLTNVFNIFVASFMVFMLLAYGATRILTQPLSLLKGKLAKVNLSQENEPLKWPVDDEIGLLIKEYNQMLLKLEKSRQALSRTEKESAWREMAQQVAHEIKNPLTPMKLSLQHLLMRIDKGEGAGPEASAKIKSILSQVDNLSDIATSFSSFAKMPIPENARTNLIDILTKVVSFFKFNEQHIKINLPDEAVYAMVDPKLIERIFNNMLINALQSEDKERSIMVTIEMQLLEQKVVISFKDNGTGITLENLQKIFLPNFTTKEEGSGIGLAIAKRGIEYAGGKIWVESELGEGSNFFIELKRVY